MHNSMHNRKTGRSAICPRDGFGWRVVVSGWRLGCAPRRLATRERMGAQRSAPATLRSRCCERAFGCEKGSVSCRVYYRQQPASHVYGTDAWIMGLLVSLRRGQSLACGKCNAAKEVA